MKKILLLIIFLALIPSLALAKGYVQPGLRKVYYGDGVPVLKMIEMREGQIREGVAVSFYDTGEVEEIAWFHDDVFDGPYRSFWPNGQQHSFRHYQAGLLDGLTADFDEEGRPCFQLTYEKGVLNGPGEFYEEGRLIKQVTYSQGWSVVSD